jgi:GT2 family glycosyltransferase
MNADDIRHPLSLEIQVSELEKMTGVDVVYQDVYYTLRQNLTFDTIARIGMKSNLPEASTNVLARGVNVPHNAPMWRRTLHDRVGLFDETFLSAGDHDFWIRASIKGAKFKKSEQVHVSYYINPDGMSTKKNSPGSSEGLKILDTYRQYAQGVTK